jgi:hypothetical protein
MVQCWPGSNPTAQAAAGQHNEPMRVAALASLTSAGVFLLTACTSQASHSAERSTPNITVDTSIRTSPPSAATTL